MSRPEYLITLPQLARPSVPIEKPRRREQPDFPTTPSVPAPSPHREPAPTTPSKPVPEKVPA